MWSDLFAQAVLVSLLAAAIQNATPILLAGLGETVCELAGVYNMGLEGTMSIGAFSAFLATWLTGSPWAGALAGIAGGMAATSIIVGLAIFLKVEQIVCGMAVNLLAAGGTAFLYKVIFTSTTPPAITIMGPAPIPFLSDIPWVGPILFEQRALTYLALLLVPVAGWLLYRSRPGLELRSIGENPLVLEARGLSVKGRQAVAVLICGALGGLGGAFLTAGSAVRFVPEMVNGRGWLAIIAVVAGAWRPGGVLAATLGFALLDSLQLHVQGVGIKLPYQILLAAPYAASLVLLAFRGRPGPWRRRRATV
jgi:general nucleoside transport system permease protein